MKRILTLAMALLFILVATQTATADRLGIRNAKLTLLRVHDVGTGWGGGSTNFINVEVVIKLNKQTDMAFGFELRDDGNRPARQGMLDLLRDAFNHGHTVNIDYDIDPGDKNGKLVRVWLTKDSWLDTTQPPGEFEQD